MVRRASAAGLAAIALTDHDTVAGVGEARAAAAAGGLRVVAGCEFSVAVPWGELHLLGYFLPHGDPDLEAFLAEQRGLRHARMVEIVRRLAGTGIPISFTEIAELAGGATLGRPHAARALVTRGVVRDIGEAFDRYLRAGRVAYVPKRLPDLSHVTGLVRRLGGVTSAAHLKERGTAPSVARLRAAGVDGIEVRHPAHDREMQHRLSALAQHENLLPTGGTDWHGDVEAEAQGRAALGTITVPLAWLDDLEHLHHQRVEERKP